MNAATAKKPDVEVTFVRVLDAPPDLVFKAWTDPEQMAQWWGPKSFTNPVCEIDARPGGKMLIHMRGPDGAVYPMTGVFREVEPPRRLVFSSAALDMDGNVLLEGETIVTFEDQGGKTQMTVRSSATAVAPVAVEMVKGMNEGWAQSLERLADLVAR
jgi:uncharacterized protein YndB with AHSA1/START domain